jgi:lambda repressor-like predicted transcriptional regulator
LCSHDTASGPTSNPYARIEAQDLKAKLDEEKSLRTWAALGGATGQELRRRDKRIAAIRTEIKARAIEHSGISKGHFGPAHGRTKRRIGKRPKKPVGRKTLIDQKLTAKGWSLRDWAREAKIDLHTVRNFVNRQSKPRPATRKSLADALGVPPHKLR